MVNQSPDIRVGDDTTDDSDLDENNDNKDN